MKRFGKFVLVLSAAMFISSCACNGACGGGGFAYESTPISSCGGCGVSSGCCDFGNW